MGDSPAYRTKAFISYSHKDKPYLERLQAHLKPFIRESSIKVWDDTQIQPGTDWKAAIERGLAEAQVVVLLVSADFLASDFVAEKELPKILLAAQQEGVTILPVILGHCVYRRVRLGQLQSVNDPASPLEGLPKHEQDKIWSQVAEQTHDTLKAKEQEWSEKAKSLFEAGKYQEALEACEYVLQSNPDDISALRYKGATLNYLARYGDALVALERAIQLKPDDAFAYKYKGSALYILGQMEEALLAFEEALKLGGREAYALTYKGATLFHLQRYEEALAALEEAAQSAHSLQQPARPLTPGYIYNSPLYGLRRKADLSAEPARPSSRPDHDNNPVGFDSDLQRYRGAALFHLQRYEESLAALKQALRPILGGQAFAKSPFTFMYEGAALFHLARYEEALEALEKAGDDAFASKYKGATLFHLEREVEALDAFEQALKREPDDVFALKYKGAALVNLEQEEEALAALEQALKLDPGDDAFIFRYYGVALLGTRRYEEALSLLDVALVLEPENADALKLKSKIEKILAYRNKLAQVGAASAPRNAAD